MGVEPTEDIFMPPNGFEVREAHRDSSAPVFGVYSIVSLSVKPPPSFQRKLESIYRRATILIYLSWILAAVYSIPDIGPE